MRMVYWIEEASLGGRCGPACVPWQPAELFAAGVGGVVSLDAECVDQAELRKAGLEHLPLYQPMVLLHDEPSRRMFVQRVTPAFDFIDRVRQRGSSVVVHCHYGCDRTGALLACYLMARAGCDAKTAIDRIRSVQPLALRAWGYVEAVELFDWLRRDAG
jgi:protein-tyrosine phosphatase